MQQRTVFYCVAIPKLPFLTLCVQLILETICRGVLW